jgi:hypothetical protein
VFGTHYFGPGTKYQVPGTSYLKTLSASLNTCAWYLNTRTPSVNTVREQPCIQGRSHDRQTAQDIAGELQQPPPRQSLRKLAQKLFLPSAQRDVYVSDHKDLLDVLI